MPRRGLPAESASIWHKVRLTAPRRSGRLAARPAAVIPQVGAPLPPAQAAKGRGGADICAHTRARTPQPPLHASLREQAGCARQPARRSHASQRRGCRVERGMPRLKHSALPSGYAETPPRRPRRAAGATHRRKGPTEGRGEMKSFDMSGDCRLAGTSRTPQPTPKELKS